MNKKICDNDKKDNNVTWDFENIGYLEDLETGERIEDIDIIEQYNSQNQYYILERLKLEKCELTEDIIKDIEEHLYIFWFGTLLNTSENKDIDYWLKNVLANKALPESIVYILKDANDKNDIFNLIRQKSMKFLNCYLLNPNKEIHNLIFKTNDSIFKRMNMKTPFETICN